jgi:uroporphyrinogen-III synthase
MRVRFVASRADGATLGHELPLPRGEILLARSDLADGELPATLRHRGARVREIAAYRTVARIEGDAGVLRRAVARGPVTIVVASPSAVDALADAIDPDTLRRATFVAIGPRTARRVRDRVGPAARVADASAAGALVNAIPSPETEEAAP